jgi:retinal G protein coupled receptor
MILYTWANALFWSSAPLFGWSRYAYEPSGTSCSVMYFPNEGYSSFIISCFCMCYVVPAMALYYCKTHYRQVGALRTVQKATTLSVCFSFCFYFGNF